jgi:hypothetical protein
MFRFLMRIFVSAPFFGLIGLLIMVPLVLGIFAAGRDLLAGKDVEHIAEILEGLGVILIGWGVAIEERHTLREMAHLIGLPDEKRQNAIDQVCHSSGIGLLILGLFAEICVEAVRLPNDVMPTEGIDPIICWVSVLFLTVGALTLLHHLVVLVLTAWFGYRPEPYQH